MLKFVISKKATKIDKIFTINLTLTKAEFPSVSTNTFSFPGNFFLIKKLEFEKTKPTQDTTFKTDIIKVVLVFSISNFFTNKNSQGRKLSAA